VVFQEPRLLPWKKVAENVVFGLSGRRTDLQRTALTALEEVGLEDRANVWPATLSGGEQQRVGLSRALVRQPQLLLLDEPFGALDALTRLKMHALLRELVSKHRPGVLMVTHDVQEALDLADRILVLDQGEIDIDIDVGQARRHSDPQAAIDGLRHQILTSLGVTSQ
jgi:ABC-type nitrate/sulfonate/bicarbonate transport system, ATPase component